MEKSFKIRVKPVWEDRNYTCEDVQFSIDYGDRYFKVVAIEEIKDEIPNNT